MDDWAVRAEAHFTGFGGVMKQELQQDAHRPFAALYFAALFSILGSHIKLMLIVSSMLRLFLAASLYALLRQLRFRWLDSAGIASLTLLFPSSDSTWLWPSASVYSLATACVLLGCLLNVHAIRDDGLRSYGLHFAGLALISAGILTNELVVPIALASGALYFMLTGPRGALLSWGIDLLVLTVVILVFTLRLIPVINGGNNHEISALSQMGPHAHVVLSESATLLTHSLLPFGTPRNLTVLGVVGALMTLAFVVMISLRPKSVARMELARWLAIALVGLLVIVLGYIMIVPANIYYVPLQPGLGNRINAVSAIGMALVLYAAVAIAARLIFRELSYSSQLVSVFTLFAVILVGIGYLQFIRTDEAAWHQSGVLQSVILVALGEHVPTPAHGSSILTLGAPTETAPGVPVFDASWDLTGAVQLKWNDPTLQAYPMAAGATIACTTERPFVNTGGSPSTWPATYPTELVDIATGAMFSVTNRHECVVATTKLGVTAATT